MNFRFKITLIFIFFLSYCTLNAQQNENISKALKLGDSLQFKEAIKILKTEIKSNPNNADAYYWAGRFSHYLVYDSRPFDNKGNECGKSAQCDHPNPV